MTRTDWILFAVCWSLPLLCILARFVFDVKAERSQREFNQRMYDIFNKPKSEAGHAR